MTHILLQSTVTTNQVDLVEDVVWEELLCIGALAAEGQRSDIIHAEGCKGDVRGNGLGAQTCTGAVEHCADLIVLTQPLQRGMLLCVLIEHL